ncbi:restriction endonuclease PLD domain-containing protein [Facklamia sp. 7083-14-GEN3]|uniref:restriction endonuclease PLD domain-containing protein n=1 Tax=Facklamia sp. 7083-14-GEN3 TaxID=2973478 RepID=UPI00215CF9BA|nr:restriction endonuclease PLD domain-containing protein [Facklamia sp. 7083-14-GEN3]MCR8968464.1 NgoFVII family restriction endonuclease [Facklamia sp. 7083-14-GEN3]
MIHYSDLFKKVFINNREFVHLRIITGYCSPNMVKLLSDLNSESSIEIFIGMALEGISYQEHSEYLDIMSKSNGKIKIYYKTKRPLNHMKLYCFSFLNNAQISYLGSANLTQNGFIKNQEILTNIDGNFDKIFELILRDSKLCNEEDIGNYIKFYNQVYENEIFYPLQEEEDNDFVNEDFSIFSNDRQFQNPSIKIPSNLKLSRLYNYYQIKIPILIPDRQQSKSRSINAWVRNQVPYLTDYNSQSFYKFFPINERFKIITDLDEELIGYINGSEDNKLLTSPNIYDYLKFRLGINENRIIEYSDILDYGNNEIYIHSDNENQFYFYFFNMLSR